MSAHAFWATSGCQSLSLVGESVNHQMSRPPKSTTKMPSFRQNGQTNTSATTGAVASSAVAILFPAPNGPSNQAAPNAQTAAMTAMTAQSKPPTQRPGCFILAQRPSGVAGYSTLGLESQLRTTPPS